MHAVPRRHRQSPPIDGAEALGRATVTRAVPGDDGRVHLRPGPSRPESGAHGLKIFSEGSRVMPQSHIVKQNGTALLDTAHTDAPVSLNGNSVSFTLNGKAVACRSDQTILEAAQQHGVEIPRLCYMEGMRPDGNC